MKLSEWLDSRMGTVDCYADIISYLPGEDEMDNSPFGVYATTDGYIFCHSETEAEIIADWLCGFDFLALDPEIGGEQTENLYVTYSYYDTTYADREEMVDKSDSIFVVYVI